jgi:hypothetical protein
MDHQPVNRTTKEGAGTKDVDLESASPATHEEVGAYIAAEAKGDREVPEPIEENRTEEKPLKIGEEPNPKRTQNSRPD